ncbi:MAG: molybdate ABC transporter permease subunit [Burkholderiaceae bacterium]
MENLLPPIWLTLKLATFTTVILLLFGIPLAWWLARTRSWVKIPLNALIALPLVLPPTVLGFYLLLAMGPNGPLGQFSALLGWGTLAFTFKGLLIGSIFYSIPFVVQPLQNAFESIDSDILEAAYSLGARPVNRFFTVVLPIAKSSILTAAIFGFAHTVGEFGIVLMIGGNIPDKTQVVSIAIYEHVEGLEYTQAHWLSAGLLVFSFAVLLILHTVNKSQGRLLKY